MCQSKGWKALFLLAIQVCCLEIAGGVCGAQGSAQNAADADQPKILFHLSDTSTTAPVKVTHVFVGDHEVALDTPVAVKGMWVRNIKVIVENVSPKDVVEGGILVLFPETGTGAPDSPILTTGANLGKYPENAFLQKDGTNRKPHDYNPTAISIPPGGTMTFLLNENADLDQARAGKMAPQITKVEIKFSSFYFGDGSAWRGGVFLVPKPPPVVWEKITPEEFFQGNLPAAR